MHGQKRNSRNRSVVRRRGRGLVSSAASLLKKAFKTLPTGAIVNTAIDALPVELHLPGGYRYCGPGTKLKERLARGDPGINKLDEACKVHDIAYSNFSDTQRRSIADRVLLEKAWQRVKSSDASVGERAAALAVSAAMKAKNTIGGGHRRRRRRVTRKRVCGCGRRCIKKKVGQRKRVRRNRSNGRGLYLKPYRVY